MFGTGVWPCLEPWAAVDEHEALKDIAAKNAINVTNLSLMEGS
jgi:hypothetical protein